MAVAYVNAGTAAVGTTSLSVPYPTTVTSGNALVLTITNKYPTNAPSTPSGWTLASEARAEGGAGANGIDTGSVYISVFHKIATGSETGNLAVTITSGNSAVGRIFQYSKAANKSWDFEARNASGINSGGGNTLWNPSTNAFTNEVVGDVILACSAINSDTYTFSGHTITYTGITFGTVNERQDSGTTQGQDCKLVMAEHPITAVSSPGSTFNYLMTASGSTTSSPAGASVFFKLGEVDPPAFSQNRKSAFFNFF